MAFCGTVLLPAALGISVEAVRFVIILLRALLGEIDPVLGFVERRLNLKRKDDDKDDGAGRETGEKQVAQPTDGGKRTNTTTGQEKGDKSGVKDSKGRQKPLAPPTQTAAQTATSPPPPARPSIPAVGPVAIIPKPKATVHSAGPTPTQHPLQGTWLSVTVTIRGSCVVAVFAQAPVTRPKGTPSLPSRFTEFGRPSLHRCPWPGALRQCSRHDPRASETVRPSADTGLANQHARYAGWFGDEATPQRDGGSRLHASHPPPAPHRQGGRCSPDSATPPTRGRGSQSHGSPLGWPNANAAGSPSPSSSPSTPCGGGPGGALPPGACAFPRRKPEAPPDGRRNRHAWATPRPA
jgi:hypothetical protein